MSKRLLSFLQVPAKYAPDWMARLVRATDNDLSRVTAFAGSVTWDPGDIAGGGGASAGTVTSVDLTAPDIFTVSGNPVTTSGTIDFTPTDPGADRFVLWDDSAGKWVYGTFSTGLTLTGTTLTATGGSGTVTSVSVVTANGVSGSVADATTTPAITLTLGDITPTSVAASGTVTGSNLSGTNTGDQTNISGNAATVTVADAAGDTTTFVLLAGSATGSLGPLTDAGLSYNANTNALTSGSFIGNLTGNVTGNADTVTTNANMTGHMTSVGNTSSLGSFTLAQLNAAISDGDVGGAGHVIEEEGTPLTARSKLNFVGEAVTVTDDSGDDATDVTIGSIQWLQFAVGDETIAIVTGTDKFSTRIPACEVLAVRASVIVAPTGTHITVDIQQENVSILSTLIRIDDGEVSSVTAASPPVIGTSTWVDDALMTIDLAGTGSGAKGVRVSMKVRWT